MVISGIGATLHASRAAIPLEAANTAGPRFQGVSRVASPRRTAAGRGAAAGGISARHAATADKPMKSCWARWVPKEGISQRLVASAPTIAPIVFAA